MNQPAKGIAYLTSPVLTEAGGVEHAFLTRKEGYSAPPFASLNFDTRDTDPAESIAKNLALLSKTFRLDSARLVLPNQVHGCEVLKARGGAISSQRADADAVITDEVDLPIGVLTADCLPVLFYDPVKRAAGVSHAGWKGTVKGVSVKTIEAMKESFGSSPKDMLVALGPYISPCCYTVGKEVAEAFRESLGADAAVTDDGQGLRLDIGEANVRQIVSAGVPEDNITTTGLCTSCSNYIFYSYRKDGGRTGRQLSFIMLR